MTTDKRRGIALLGSTGVIGRLTLEVAAAYPERFRIVSMAADSNDELLAEQARAFRPDMVSLYDPGSAARLAAGLPGIPVGNGLEGLTAAAVCEGVDIVVVAVSGAIGLLPTLEAVRAGKDIALANKETLVLGGSIVMPEVARRGVRLLPVDSEHSALFQAMRGEDRGSVDRLVLTASGGPFAGLSAEAMRGITPEEALRHPTWNMGPKITVDSATMMNKGLEVIEAMWLFDMPNERIDVLVHPQSIVHSLVVLVDGSVIAQMGCPDMRLPIGFALAYPERISVTSERLDLAGLSGLTFSRPDESRFASLRLARETAAAGGSAPGVMNAANEVAVRLFLEKKIGFTAISELTEMVLQKHRLVASPSLDELLYADGWARREALAMAAGFQL